MSSDDPYWIQVSCLEDRIHEKARSDASYASETESSDGDANNNNNNDTPATPYSTTSSKYPSELKTHLCPFEGCTKAFNRPARLQEHIRSHRNERIFKCQYDGCEKTFLRASHLNHHVKSAHTQIRDYVCDRPGCGKSFVTGTRLRRHLAAHDGREKYRCTEYPPCNETFRKHSTLHRHVMMVHLNRKPFPCTRMDPETGQQCTQAFDTAGHLRAHESRMHSQTRFVCSECSKQQSPENQAGVVCFSTYAQLQAHIREEHPPQCPQCPVVCSTSRELRRHLEIVHGDVSLDERRLFPCPEPGCDRRFTKSGNLTVHIRTVHQGEKRFVCGETDLSRSKRVEGWDGRDGCGKRYGSKLALEEHVRTAHLGLPNTKTERRLRQGMDASQRRSRPTPSTLTLLTGEGYAEETGRQIACFVSDCPYRFHRDYDLWVHMRSKHGHSEEDIQALFMQRALTGDGSEDGLFGLHGVDWELGEPSQPTERVVAPEVPSSGDPGHARSHHVGGPMKEMEFLMDDQDHPQPVGTTFSTMPGEMMVDPALSQVMEG